MLSEVGSRLLPPWLVTLATAWLFTVSMLIAWSLAPMVIGWRATVVTSGSMRPDVGVGDVVLIDPFSTPRPGQVALWQDDDAPSGQVLHRLVRAREDGGMITRGDANQSVDSTVRSIDDARGVARLLIPHAGSAALAVSGQGSTSDLLWVLSLVGAVVIVGADRRLEASVLTSAAHS